MRAQLTKTLLGNPPAIPPGKNKVLVFDTKIAGFMIEVRPSCTTFYVKWKDRRGCTRSVKIGRHGSDVSLEQARKRATELRSAIALGGDPHADRQAEKAALTVAEFVEQRFLPHQKARKKSWDEDVKLLRKRILPAWGGKLLSDITTADVQRLHDGVVAEGLTPATANRHLCLVKRMLSLALVWGEIAKDPARPVRLHRENGQRSRYLNEGEIAGLLAALDADPDRVGASVIRLLLMTGARAGEALAARWEHIDLERGIWTLPNPKGGRVAHKPLGAAAVALLKSQVRVEGNSFVFPGDRPGDHRYALRWTWDRVCKRAGIEGCRVHDLRHTFASLLVSRGVSLFVVQKLLNHSTPSMTQRYSHLAPDHLLDASNLAAQALTGPSAPRGSD
ncbi:MAG: tyrosine-type recombinase/integrase [Rhodospirillaceae bacterium]